MSIREVAREMRANRAKVRRLSVIPQVILPPDVSDPSDAEAPMLPPDVADPSASERHVEDMSMYPVHLEDCGCKNVCSRKILPLSQQHIVRMRAEIDPTAPEGKLIFFNLVKSAHDNKSWRLFGRDICREAFLKITGASKNRLDRTLQGILKGHLQPFADLREYNGNNDRQREKAWNVDAFFTFLYQFMAEPLAEEETVAFELTSQGAANMVAEWVQATAGNPLAVATAGMEGGVDRRLLPHMSKEELYDLYCLHKGNQSERTSKTCFLKVYHKRWRHLLGIREVAQHARCDTCAELSKARKEHPDKAEREKAGRKYKAHLNLMFDDRRLDMRLTFLSELSTSPSCSFQGLLHVRIDGMDQAKFKCPRNLEDAKQWGVYWRPTLHITGVILEGVAEVFFIMDPDSAPMHNSGAQA